MIVALAALFFMVNIYIVQSTKTQIFTDAQTVPSAQTALVLGARVYANERVSQILGDRLETALDLYREKKVQKFIVSGDHGRTDYNEVKAMRDYLVDGGVPAEDIFMDHAGFDTYDSVYRARDIFQVESLIIVSQGFHLPRALYIANALGVPATGINADRREYTRSAAIRNALREPLARFKAFNSVILRTKPTYLGDQIPVTGDGRVTDDEMSK